MAIIAHFHYFLKELDEQQLHFVLILVWKLVVAQDGLSFNERKEAHGCFRLKHCMMAIGRAEISKEMRRPFTPAGMTLGLAALCRIRAGSPHFLWLRKRGTLHKIGTIKHKCSSSCWNLWCQVNADSWDIQKCVMLGVLSSLAGVLARGVV